MKRKIFLNFSIIFIIFMVKKNLISGDFTIKSISFKNNDVVSSKNSCNGLSPQFIISNIPKGTKNLFLIIEDPDAPTPKKPYIHFIGELKLDLLEIPEGKLKEFAKKIIKNDADTQDYFGPCPAKGEHHYFFTIIALNDNQFKFDEHTTGYFRGTWNKTSGFIKEVKNNIIGFAQLMGKFGKKAEIK